MATTTSVSPQSPTVYEPTTVGLPALVPYARGVWERRPLIWEMARTKMKAQHYNTVLGQVWILLDPMLMALVYLMLRTVIRPVGTAEERWSIIAHLIVSIFFFNYTRTALSAGAKAITNNKALVLNAAFPRGVLPVEAVLRAFLDFLPTLVVYFGLHALLGQPFGAGALLFLPLLILLQTMFNFGLGCFFAPLTVFFRDTEQFLSYILRIWFFSTPILYTVEELSSMPSTIQTVLKLNPLFPFFAMLEQIWDAQVPSPAYVLGAAAWASVAAVVGVVMFLAREREFAVRL